MEAIELDAKALEILGKPGVYMFLRDDLAIYIGSSEYLGDRVFSKRHHKRNETESTLIAELRPALNGRNWKKAPALKAAKLLGVTVDHVVRTNLRGQ